MSKKSSSSSDTTTVTLAHGAFVEGKYVQPGEQVTLSNAEAQGLTAAGYVVTDAPVGEVESGAAAGS